MLYKVDLGEPRQILNPQEPAPRLRKKVVRAGHALGQLIADAPHTIGIFGDGFFRPTAGWLLDEEWKRGPVQVEDGTGGAQMADQELGRLVYSNADGLWALSVDNVYMSVTGEGHLGTPAHFPLDAQWLERYDDIMASAGASPSRSPSAYYFNSANVAGMINRYIHQRGLADQFTAIYQAPAA